MRKNDTQILKTNQISTTTTTRRDVLTVVLKYDFKKKK